MSTHVRERMPLAVHYIAEAPSGRPYRWGGDEPDAADVPSGVRFGDTMPGGFSNFDATLPRKPGVEYSDLDRFSTIYVRGVGEEPAGEYMLERAARVSGEQVAVSPGAVGWQANLDHNESAQMVYVGRELGAWQPMSATRRAAILAIPEDVQDHAVDPDKTGLPEMRQAIAFDTSRATRIESYEIAADDAAELYYDFVATPGHATFTDWSLEVWSATDDTLADATLEVTLTAASGSGYVTINPARRVLMVITRRAVATSGIDGQQIGWRFRNLARYGAHGLPRHGPDPGGLLASDVIAHAVGTWAPRLQFTTGTDGTIQPSDFVHPHLEFRDATTAHEIVRQANRVHLHDYAVWDDRTFYYHEQGARGRHWLARVGPARLEETGQDANRAWESVFVEYQDTSGTKRTVGPPGSGADTEDALLVDSDPEGPAAGLGAPKREKLTLGTSTAPVAIEVGRRFLEGARQLDSSGRASFTGYVEDDKGTERPYWQVRSGDTVSFVDAADPSPRRIVKTEKSPDEATCSVDLDAPPEGMEALLERLDAAIVPVGV